MVDVKELLKKRYEVFNEFTAVILDELTDMQSAATVAMAEEIGDHQITWYRVALLEDDHLVMEGQVEFQLGEKISTPDGDIELTEDMMALMNRAVRIGLPVDMAQRGVQDEILKYLKVAKEKQQEVMHKAMQEDMVHTATNQSFDTVANLAGDFRSAGLTKEQIKSMLMFAHQSTGKVN